MRTHTLPTGICLVRDFINKVAILPHLKRKKTEAMSHSFKLKENESYFKN